MYILSTSETKTIQQAIAILDSHIESKEKKSIDSAKSAREYLRLKFSLREITSFGGILMDQQHNPIEYTEFFQGSVTECRVHPREIVKACIQCNAATIILAYHFPSGYANEVSQVTKDTVKALMKILKIIDVRVLDVFNIGNDEILSFAEQGLIFSDNSLLNYEISCQ
jgi:DNA repair protein RadC